MPDVRDRKMTGAEKAAIFLMMMGEEYTSEVFKNLEPDEISRLVAKMSEIKYVPEEDLRRIMEEFLNKSESTGQFMVEYETFLRKVEGSLGKDKARAVYRELEKNRQGDPFSYFESIDANLVVNIIKGEHPQTIALILAYLESNRAAAILSGLPEQIQADVAMRIVKMEQVPTEVIQEVDHVLQKEVRGLGDSGTRDVEGTTTLANILNEIDRTTEEQIMSRLEEDDEQVAEEIRQLMFVFEDLVKVDDRAFREILKHVDRADLAVGLRTASEGVKEKIFNNLSERAGDMLREDMEDMGPVRLSEVEEAQQKVLRVARQLEDEGKIVLWKGGEDVLV
ncbi:MAG: flagellar motor switch protein FliG [Desulfobacterales bacterium]|nr:flagellar motor switch protein FliG [Desulfobacterales bacterium]